MKRLGPAWGRRVVPMAGLVGGSVFIAVGARTANAIVAAVCLALATALVLSVEGPFWATMTELAGRKSGAAGGVMNMGSNLGGLVSPALTPVLAAAIGWENALHVAAGISVVGGLLWLGISPRPGRGLTARNARIENQDLTPFSLVAEGFGGLDAGRLPGGPEAGAEGDEDGERRRGQRLGGADAEVGEDRLLEALLEQRPERPRQENSRPEPERDAGQDEEHRLEQELGEDRPTPGPEGATRSDLAGPFLHADEEGVEDAARGDEERERGDAAEDGRLGPLGGLEIREGLAGRIDLRRRRAPRRAAGREGAP